MNKNKKSKKNPARLIRRVESRPLAKRREVLCVVATG